MKIRFGRARSDPEKAVLPAIIWTHVGDDQRAAYALSIGWWDFHVTLAWIRPSPSRLSSQGKGS